ncbi:hypothetical protein [Candidatus Nitrosocosmicus arcticus]|uniref:Uncharacterized protein n=1 Tax=Candidatus Nitrosocosmicus arcticus TaxID=2035267 RepID=A0A557SU05_9ARCH|nr:hypothetical protein [Candidatus Nitrosocosmicus arcticus]TVP40083.1 hypothetical protein NARC_100146 [Candidatus Nitrosocosmicus arcticus]
MRSLIFSGYHHDKFKEIESMYDPIFGDRLIILKKVKSVRQLRNTEKEWVRLCYKEAILKGFMVIKDIQCYIASKTKIWIERSGIEYLKKSEEMEDKQWYYRLAVNHHAYISVYRKCIDEIELIKKECWNIVMSPDTEGSVKVQCLREIHSLAKTLVLLLRDLPFVTRLSTYYDEDIIKSMFDKSKEPDSIPEQYLRNKQNVVLDETNMKIKNPDVKSGLKVLMNKKKDDNIQSESDSSEKLKKNIDDSIMEEMSKQLNYSATDLDSKTYTDSVKKLKEIFEE